MGVPEEGAPGGVEIESLVLDADSVIVEGNDRDSEVT